MNFLRQFLKSLLAVSAILLLIVLLLVVGAIPYDAEVFEKFLIGSALLVFGQTIFLITIENSIIKVGRSVGSSLMKVKKVWIIILFGFLFGLVTTIAEPDVQVLVGELLEVNPFISAFLLTSIFGIGAGLFVSLALIRILKNIGLKWVLLILYSIIFVLALFCPEQYLGLAFDSGGVSTGAVTVPFLLSLIIGVCAVKSGSTKDDSFGAAAIVSTGPIIAVLIMGIISGAPENTINYIPENYAFLEVLSAQSLNVVLALSPLLLTFIVAQFTLLKFPLKQAVKIFIGFLIAGMGLILFLTGVYYGFSIMGMYIGSSLVNTMGNWFILLFGFLIGSAIVFTEPATIVLVEQIEGVTAGFLKKKVVFITLALGVAIAVMLCFVHVLYNIKIWYFLLPFYSICLILNFIVPKIFTSISFDSGGIAAGTMAVAFILPICIGLCSSLELDIILVAFGAVGLVATVPIFTVQVLGLIYMVIKKRKDKKLKKIKFQEKFEEKLEK